MRARLNGWWISLGVGLCMGWIGPAQAQITDPQVGALVEALRLAAPQTGQTDDGLYSDWQIKPENIPRWSQSCLGRELSVSEFESSPDTARSILVCVMRDILQEEYQASGQDVSLAVRRAASWWMTGDPVQYDSASTAEYTERVLSFYQQQPVATEAPSPAAPATRPSPIYDRYMRAAYAATEQRDYDTALLYFRRALDERPGDAYAEQAIANVERYRSTQNADNAPESDVPDPQAD